MNNGVTSRMIIDVSVIMVSYNTCSLTISSLRSIYGSIFPAKSASSLGQLQFEVIVVDNGSQDDSVKQIKRLFPQVVLLVNDENVGFAKANNQAMACASGRYVLLLNSDTIIQPDTLAVMLDFMEGHPEAGAAGCKIILPDGKLDKACKRGFPRPIDSFYYVCGFSRLFPRVKRFNQYQLGYLDPDELYPVDCLVGAFMFVRRTTIDQVGMLDEDFFMYGEDVDWCYRIKQAGWVNYYCPLTQIIHYKGAGNRRRSSKIVYEFHRAMWLFHKKHYWNKYSKLTNVLVYAGIKFKLAIAMVKNQLR